MVILWRLGILLKNSLHVVLVLIFATTNSAGIAFKTKKHFAGCRKEQACGSAPFVIKFLREEQMTLYSDEIVEHVVYPGTPRRNLRFAELLEYAIRRNEGVLAGNGAFAAITAPRTGRSPKDKFIVKDELTADTVDWKTNQPMAPDVFDRLFNRFADIVHQSECFVFNGYAGAHPQHRLGVRIITEYAWHSMFVRQLFIRPTAEGLKGHRPEFRVICMPSLRCDPSRDGTNSDAVIAINFRRRVALIGGTRYAGEIKKSVFSVMNRILPNQGIMTMHCSANVGADDDVALFFGLSGTGKTTLSADPGRRLIGDDEHAWADDGVFNIEGGCYAKCINLNRESEPEIWDAIRFGAVLENVVLQDNRDPDYDDSSITENTRAAYPINNISNAQIPGMGGHPKYIILLTADATCVLPPVARLSRSQALYHFLSGYTSKLAGTETGITTPQAVFSACFASPFLPLNPTVYAKLLGEKIDRHGTRCFLVNTGWTGGGHGVGKRISLAHTRAIVNSILDGSLDEAPCHTEPIFNLSIPDNVPGVPAQILDSAKTWPDPAQYQEAAKALAMKFRENFKQFEQVGNEIKSAEPIG